MKKCEAAMMECVTKMELAKLSVEMAEVLTSSDHLEASKMVLEKARTYMDELGVKMAILKNLFVECPETAPAGVVAKKK